MNDILYIALTLTSSGHDALFELMLDIINELGPDFRPKFYCHHSTLAFRTNLTPEILDFAYKNEGKMFPITVTGVGVSEKAVAVSCEYDAPCANSRKHITLATNTTAYGKPVDSNKIEDWTPIKPFQVYGTLTIYYKN